MTEDNQLIRETLSGNSGAFGELVRRYQNRLFNTLVRVTSCREEAEDVVQEAFVQAYTKLESFRGKSTFYTWLYRIAFNLSVSRSRRKRPEISVDQIREKAGIEPVDGAAEPTYHMEQQERAEQVRSALNTLSTEHRSIIVLREIDNFDYDAIADTLKIPVGTVRSRLHRARLQMRQELQQIFQEHG